MTNEMRAWQRAEPLHAAPAPGEYLGFADEPILALVGLTADDEEARIRATRLLRAVTGLPLATVYSGHVQRLLAPDDDAAVWISLCDLRAKRRPELARELSLAGFSLEALDPARPRPALALLRLAGAWRDRD